MLPSFYLCHFFCFSFAFSTPIYFITLPLCPYTFLVPHLSITIFFLGLYLFFALPFFFIYLFAPLLLSLLFPFLFLCFFNTNLVHNLAFASFYFSGPSPIHNKKKIGALPFFCLTFFLHLPFCSPPSIFTNSFSHCFFNTSLLHYLAFASPYLPSPSPIHNIFFFGALPFALPFLNFIYLFAPLLLSLPIPFLFLCFFNTNLLHYLAFASPYLPSPSPINSIF